MTTNNDEVEHEHDIEYGQEANDWQKNVMQVRCLKCGYKSYSILRPSELTKGQEETREERHLRLTDHWSDV